MNSDKVKELQEQWGDKPCEHPDIIAEDQADGTTHHNCGALSADARSITMIGRDRVKSVVRSFAARD